MSMDDQTSTTMIHLAGPCIRFGNLQRQRCSWCGYVMVDDDLSLMAMAIPECTYCGSWDRQSQCPQSDAMDGGHSPYTLDPPKGFPFEALVEVTLATGFQGGSVVEVVQEEDGSVKVPENCCMRLPPEMTGRSDPRD